MVDLEYSCVDELSRVVMVEYSCVSGVKLSRVVMIECSCAG